MSEFLGLANYIESIPLNDDIVEVINITSMQRDMIVAALRGADAIRSLAELPPLGDT